MNTPELPSHLEDTPHGSIVVALRQAKALLSKLEDAAGKRLASQQLRDQRNQLALIDLRPIDEAIEVIENEEAQALRAREVELQLELEAHQKTVRVHERYAQRPLPSPAVNGNPQLPA